MKSYVSMEQHICRVCGQTYDTGSILMDRRVRDVFEATTLTGMGMCPAHQKMADDGFIALVEVDPAKTPRMSNGTVKADEAYRTGTVVHLRRTVAEQLINIPLTPIMFIPPEVTAYLQRLQQEATE